MHIESLNVGQPRPLEVRGREIRSGIFKQPVAGDVELTQLGLAGDVQVNRRYHGGADKAINVYPAEHYPHWERVLGHPLEFGAFGENLTTRGLLETEVAIGDQFRIGGTICEVTQARQPCGTLAARHGEPKLVKWVEEAGFTGFYLRVLTAGRLTAGLEIELLKREPEPITVREAYAIIRNKRNVAGAQRLLSMAALSAAWREELLARQ